MPDSCNSYPWTILFVPVLVVLLALAGCSGPSQPQLLAALPDYVSTPDGMTVAPDGDLVVACPNFSSYAKGASVPSLPACFVRISKNGSIRKWVDSPVLAENGRSCPMGIEFGPAGELYVVDNQNWATGNGANGEINQGHILRLRFEGGKLAETTIVAQGISHPNGVRYRNGQLSVTVSMLPKVKRPDGLLTSAVYRFPAGAKEIQVDNTLQDPNLMAAFVTENKHDQYGVDGLVFDSKGNLFVGNFGDGTLQKLAFDAQGALTSNTVFARTDHDYPLDPHAPGFLTKAVKAKMRTTDGMSVDSSDNIHIADFSKNAVAKATPRGEI